MEVVLDEDKVCVYCADGSRDCHSLNHVASRFQGDDDKKHLLDTIIEHAKKLKLDTLATNLNEHKQQHVPTYIHLYCRTLLKKTNLVQNVVTVENEPGSFNRISRSEVEKKKLKDSVSTVEKCVSLIENIETNETLRKFPQKIQKNH